MSLSGTSIFGILFVALCAAAANPILSLRAAAPERTLKTGARILVRIKVSNESNYTVSFSDQNPDCDYNVTVLNNAGLPAEESRYKKDLQCPVGPHLTGRNVSVTLKPGESHDDEIELSHLFEMAAPDRYSVQVSRTFSQIGAFSSNPVAITITSK
jgi:hypothetical protein